jgi:xanthine/CO dehydrogenase XdhC/CoxF family maturation factor
MSDLVELLERIERHSIRGDAFAVIRVLGLPAGAASLFCVRGREIVPSISDSRIAERIIETAASVLNRGAGADISETVDEHGRPLRLVVEGVSPRRELLVFGAGHVGQAVALMGSLVGYQVTVIDDRGEFASRERLPDARIGLVVSDFADATSRLPITSSTAIVIVTRGHQYDELCLKGVVKSQAFYVGMIGSRRRVLSVFKKLSAEGFSDSDLRNVRAPIGLAIGARSPQEIAVAILAEIIQQANGSQMDRKGEGNGI